MSVIQKQRLSYTIIATVISAVFMLFIFGGLFGANTLAFSLEESNSLEEALHASEAAIKGEGGGLRPSPDSKNIQCIVFTAGTSTEYTSPNINYYSAIIDQIKKEAAYTKNGKFKVDSSYFIVSCAQIDGGYVYAVYDRTTHHNDIVNRAWLTTLFYCLSLICVGIIAYLLSSKTLQPVEEAMQKQRDLIANASHELKTPLTVISTDLSVIKLDPTTTVEENEKWFDSIDEQIKRMQGLIQNMLELSKLEETTIKKEDLNFSSIVEKACLEFEVVCFESGNSLVTEIDQDIHVLGEKNSLERLIMILLDNANKYCGDKGKVGCYLSKDAKKLSLKVMNTGAIISEEDAKHVFDRFYRSDGARQNNDNKNSYGLGLSIAQATVHAHGGVISCKGVEGKGTIFEVSIPLPKNKNN